MGVGLHIVRNSKKELKDVIEKEKSGAAFLHIKKLVKNKRWRIEQCKDL